MLPRLQTPCSVFLTLVIASVTVGCSRSRHDAGETYYLVATNIKLPYWQTALDGLKRAASDLKVQAELVGPDKYETKKQPGAYHKVESRKPAGILVSPADPELMKPEIDAAVAAGI